MTGLQKIALSLEKGGYTHAEIARRLNLKNRESATRLIGRARRSLNALKAAMAELVGGGEGGA